MALMVKSTAVLTGFLDAENLREINCEKENDIKQL